MSRAPRIRHPAAKPLCREALAWLHANGHDLAGLTGQDARALAAVAHCWTLYAMADAAGQAAALGAVALLLQAMQPKYHALARELIAWQLDCSDRERVWNLLPALHATAIDGRRHADPSAQAVAASDAFRALLTGPAVRGSYDNPRGTPGRCAMSAPFRVGDSVVVLPPCKAAGETGTIERMKLFDTADDRARVLAEATLFAHDGFGLKVSETPADGDALALVKFVPGDGLGMPLWALFAVRELTHGGAS